MALGDPSEIDLQSCQESATHRTGEINEAARKCILAELRRLKDFLVKRSQRDIKGASLLILVDHFSQSYCVKMIDLSSIKIY